MLQSPSRPCAGLPNVALYGWLKSRKVTFQRSPRSTVIATAEGSSASSLSGVNVSLEEADKEVLKALRLAEEAAESAATKLDGIEKLASAREKTVLDEVFSMMKRLFAPAALVACLTLCHKIGVVAQVLSGFLGAILIGAWGFNKGALSASGALAAIVVGSATLSSSYKHGAVLLAFFFSSSKLTHLNEDVKDVDEDFKKGGQRDWKQVCCNGAVPTLLTVAYGALTACRDTSLAAAADWRVVALSGAFLGYYACCCGDTWASEIGQLSEDTPRLITTGRRVRRGTNGGVTLLGLAASMGGGLAMGVTGYVFTLLSPSLPRQMFRQALNQWQLIPLGMAAGLVGSMVDSLLGATLQFTGFNRKTQKLSSKPGEYVVPIAGLHFLDNNMVNLLSASITAAITAVITLLLFT